MARSGVEMQRVLIIDNATTCAMRLKSLIDIHGAEARIVYWNDWQVMKSHLVSLNPCILVIEQTVPELVVKDVIQALPNPPAFLIYNPNRPIDWRLEQAMTPLAMSLTNYELIEMLSPYWLEDKACLLPKVLILDEDSDSLAKVQFALNEANLECRSSSQLYGMELDKFDVLAVNIGDDNDRIFQLHKVRLAHPNIGILAYGREKDFEGLSIIENLLAIEVDEVLDVAQLQMQLLAKVYGSWRKKSEQKDEGEVLRQLEFMAETLMERSLMLEVLFASSLDSILAFDQDGVIDKANESFYSLTGKEEDSPLPINFLSVLSQESKHHLMEIMLSDYVHQQHRLDIRIRHTHNVYIPVSATINRINLHGRWVFMAILRNISSQQIQENILQQRNAKLSYQVTTLNKKREIESQQLRQQQRARAAFVEKLCALQMNAEHDRTRMQQKLDNVRAIMQLEAGQVGRQVDDIELRKHVEEAISRVQALARSQQVTIENRIQDSALAIRFDPEQFGQILDQLLINSVIYNLVGGEVRLNFEAQEDGWTLSVIDTGQGILEFKQAGIFDLYQSNLQDTINLHTGLPLAQHLARLNNAILSCENHELDGKPVGARFNLVFNPVD